MPNIPCLHPSDDDNFDHVDGAAVVDDHDDGGDDDAADADDIDADNADDLPSPILSESFSIGLRVVQITKHHSVPRHLHQKNEKIFWA